jgi:hypothetical protein
VQTWAAFRWNTEAVKVVLAHRDCGRFASRDLARRVVMSEIETANIGWRQSRFRRLKHEMLPKLLSIRADLLGDATINRAVVNGLKFVIVSPEQLACAHAQQGSVLCDCLSEG